jgi:vacuolar-type H+-ATPase subunit H
MTVRRLLTVRLLRFGAMLGSTIGAVSEENPPGPGPPHDAPRPRGPGRARSAAAAAEQVAAIVGAAEESAKRMVQQTEERVRERIAEGERAAQNRVTAAEEEADELRHEAEGKALDIVARAEENADKVLGQAREDAAQMRAEAEARARDVLRDARTAASDVRTEGLEIVDNLREMGDSLRSNAERLLRDVQMIHSRMLAELDRVDGGIAPEPTPRRRSARPPTGEGDAFDVPEFIPPG